MHVDGAFDQERERLVGRTAGGRRVLLDTSVEVAGRDIGLDADPLPCAHARHDEERGALVHAIGCAPTIPLAERNPCGAVEDRNLAAHSSECAYPGRLHLQAWRLTS